MLMVCGKFLLSVEPKSPQATQNIFCKLHFVWFKSVKMQKAMLSDAVFLNIQNEKDR